MRSWRVWLGFGISFVFLYFAVRGQNFERIGQALREASYIWLVPALLAYFLGVVVRSIRWHYLLRSVQDIAPRRIFPVVTIGFMANNVLPFRAGEVVRAYALSARYGVRKSAALATIAVERIFDGMTMLIFMLVASLSIALTSDLQAVAIIATILFPLLTILLVLFVFMPSLRELAITLSVRLMPGRVSSRVEQMAQSFFDGLGILKRRQDLVSVGLASLLAWLLEATMYLLIAEGFSLHVSPLAILMVTAVANLATLIPSSPGYVGPFETGVLLVLNGALGIERELALSFAIVVHAALYFPITLLGLVYWWRESLSWREVRRSEGVVGDG